MTRFSPGIQNFLAAVCADPTRDVVPVPRSDSCGGPGDILFFRYSLGPGPGSRAARLLMLVEPITRDPKTGNLLLIGFKVPEEGSYTAASLESLYKNRELPEENYRTYMMKRIYGILRKIVKTEEPKEGEF